MQKAKKILIIGHVWPQPNASAAGEHMVHLLRFFKKMDYEIMFVSAAHRPEGVCVLEKLNIRSQIIAINNDTFDDLLNDFLPTVVLFDRFMVEEQFAWRVKNISPEAIRILDTEDLHFLRKQRQQQLKKESEINKHSDIVKRELASIYRCDLSLIISKAELDVLQTAYGIPKQLLHYLPLLNEVESIEETPSFESRKDVVFVGNFLHEPNWHTVQTLKKDIWPILRKRLPKTKIHIYGSHATPKNYQLNNEKEGFLVHGYIKDIEAVLKNAKLLLAPISFGAGQKGKLLKAMQCGTPSVTTTFGVEGMHFGAQWPGGIADDFEGFINTAEQLYTDKKLWDKAKNKIEPILFAHFNFEQHFKMFKQRLAVLKKDLEQHRFKNITGEILWHHSMRSTEYMSRWIMEKNK